MFLGYAYEGEYDSLRRSATPLYFIPADTLTSETASCLGIRDERDLYGGVVRHPVHDRRRRGHRVLGEELAARRERAEGDRLVPRDQEAGLARVPEAEVQAPAVLLDVLVPRRGRAHVRVHDLPLLVPPHGRERGLDDREVQVEEADRGPEGDRVLHERVVRKLPGEPPEGEADLPHALREPEAVELNRVGVVDDRPALPDLGRVDVRGRSQAPRGFRRVVPARAASRR